MATPLNTILNYFKTGLKPTQAQFWASWSSFWHKDEAIPISAIESLQSELDAKADKTTEIIVDASTLESFNPNKQDGYLAGNVFVSYINEASTDPDLDFKKLFIYQCVADAATGESPETHPLKWERIGETMTFTSSTTANGWVALSSQMYALTGMKDGHTVAVLQTNAVYKYNIVTGNWDYFCELKPVIVQVPGTSTTAVMSQKAVTDAIAAASGGGSGLASTWEANIAAIRALTSHNTGNDVGDYATLNIYEYDATLSTADDGDTYLKPNDVSGNGRWFKKKQLALKSEVVSLKKVTRRIAFNNNTSILCRDFYPETSTIDVAMMVDIATLQYSTDNITFTPITLPLVVYGNVWWRITFSPDKTSAFLTLTGKVN